MSQRPTLVILDVETSGLSRQMDWILQLAAIKVDKKTFQVLDQFNEYINPEVPYEISPAALETHGLTKEFISRQGKSLRQVGPAFLKFIEGSDIGGFNSNGFDIEFIYKDLSSVGLQLPVEGITFYDVRWMQAHLVPNTLEALYGRYVGRTMEEAGLGAHNAASDVEATRAVMEKQFEQFGLQWEEIDGWSENQLLVPDGTVRRANKDGEPERVVFSQGKYRDKDVYSVLQEDPGYLRWCRDKMFSAYTLQVVRDYCRRKEQESKKA